MNVPSYVARIETKYDNELKVLNEKINHALLHYDFHENASGYNVIRVSLDNWPDGELQKYIKSCYIKEKWDIEFEHDYDDDENNHWIEIHKAN